MTDDVFLGLLKPEEEKDLGKTLDEIVDFKKVFSGKPWMGMALESIDGLFFTTAIRELDNRLADKIPPNYKPQSRAVLLAVIARDWEGVVETVPALLNVPIDIPGLDEDTELALLMGLAQAIYMAIYAYANKKLKSDRQKKWLILNKKH